jgi:alkylation response protein AidB-like acyl-CoA dehydrogenase
VRPIKDIVGDEMFNEVFFDDVHIPVSCRLGGEGEGWQVAMGTLGRERVGTAGLAITMAQDLRAMISAARACNPAALDDPDIRDRISRAWTQIELTKLLNYRALTKIIKGQKNWPEVPLAKLQWSHLAQYLAELAVDMLGPQGLLLRGATDAVDNGSWARLYSFQRYTSIGAGATEVQKNIIADRALLPKK